ncbi:MAG: hypothetical protein ACTSVV_11485 [Promethearchaeota archaeon]
MVKISGGDGSSLEKAIIISDCNDLEGVDQEYLIMHNMFGKFQLIEQRLIKHKGKLYDQLIIEVENEIIEIFFDITDFFGKY